MPVRWACFWAPRVELMLELRELNACCCAGVLLHGPSGSGKTTLVRAVAAQTGAFFSYIHGPELHSPYPGEAEAALRRKFQDLHERVLAARCSQNYSVGLLFIDEIDALCPKRSDGALPSAAPEARLVATLLTLMDGIDSGDRGARGTLRESGSQCGVQDVFV